MFDLRRVPQNTRTLLANVVNAKRFGLQFQYEQLSGLLRDLIETAVREAFDLDISGPEKKQFVLDAVGYLFDTVAPVVPLPWWLVFFRVPLLRIARRVVLVVADQFIEYVYERIKEELEPDPA